MKINLRNLPGARLFLLLPALALATMMTTACTAAPQTGLTPRSKPAVAALPPTVWTLNLRGLSTDERFTALCLQGLANRQRAQLYLDTGPTVRWMQWDKTGGPKTRLDGSAPQIAPPALTPTTAPVAIATKPATDPTSAGAHPSICDYWMDELTTRNLARFDSITLLDAIIRFTPQLKGVILYEKLSDDLPIAATMAGLRDAIPMTPAVYQKLFGNAVNKLPVIFDIRTLYPTFNPEAERRIEAHHWMIDNLLPQCDLTGALSRNRTYGLDEHDTLIDVDLAVQHRWATYDLTYLSPETAESSTKPHPKYGLTPPDAAPLIRIMESLKPWSEIYGWGHPGERSLVKRASKHRQTFVCSGTANSSFYHHMPMLTDTLVQKNRPLNNFKLEDKTYIVFMVNEGDTIKYLASLGNGGSWVQPERGSLPINWGINPQLHLRFPGLVSYYLATATHNDYFFAATSGWGYVHPDALPVDAVMPYAELVSKGAAIGGLQHFDPWWTESLRVNNTLYDFLHTTGLRGMTQWKGFQRVDFSPNGTPVIYSNNYYTLKDPVAFSEKLLAEQPQTGTPWFVVVYGGEPRQFAQVARRLPTDKFKIVLLDEFFEVARQARSKVEGKTFEPAKPTTKPVAPGDVLAPVN